MAGWNGASLQQLAGITQGYLRRTCSNLLPDQHIARKASKWSRDPPGEGRIPACLAIQLYRNRQARNQYKTEAPNQSQRAT